MDVYMTRVNKLTLQMKLIYIVLYIGTNHSHKLIQHIHSCY